MPITTPMPRSLDAWLQQLGQLCLPIEQEQHTRLRRTLSDGRKNWRDIADQIELCPTFALQVLREANQSTSSLSEPADSLEIALARLGLKRCEALLAQTPALPEAEIPLALRQILLDCYSEHVGVLAEPAPSVFIDSIANGQVAINSFAYVSGPRAVYGVRSDLYFTMLQKFAAAHIALSSPGAKVSAVAWRKANAALKPFWRAASSFSCAIASMPAEMSVAR